MKTKILTINQLFEKIHTEHWNQPRFLRSGWAKEASNLYTRLIQPTFGEKLHSALTAAQIRAWHGGLALTPFQANRALEVFSKMLSFAEEREWRAQGTNVCKLVKPYKEKKRKRFATPDEIQKLGVILDRESAKNPKAVAFIYLLLFSGARPRSLERSTWNDFELVEFENQTFGMLTFNGKSTEATGEDEQVIIPPQVLSLISPPQFAKLDELIFGIKMPKEFWRKVRKEAGCEDLQARDLRRTFATVGFSSGMSVGIIGQLLNHRSHNTTLIYARLMNDKRLAATKAVADQMSLLLKGGAK